MSAWKSPLLYLGILIILVAGSALAAPLFVNWDAYRADLETYGRTLAGREVRIAGAIEARLFPWPVLRLEDVRVANPEGGSTPNLMSAGSIELEMQLAPLISGHVQIESIEIDRATFGFERLRSGEWSWSVRPQAPLGRFVDPERVSLAAITLTNATVILADAQRGGLARLENVEAGLSAPALSGPWKLRGRAAYRGAPIDVALNVGKLSPGEPARVGLNIDPGDGAGLSYGFDGEVGRMEGKAIKGQLKIAPATRGKEPKGETEAETRGWPRFQLRATVEADADTVDLTQIEIAPGATTAAGSFVTGDARIKLGRDIDVDARLETARLDLDWLMRGNKAFDRREVVNTLSGVLRQLPEGLTLGLAFDVTSLAIGGETLDASRIKVEASRDRLTVEEASLALPGQSRIGVGGLLVVADGGSEFSGDFTLDSVSLRDLAEWSLVDHRDGMRNIWTGARGRLKLQGKLDLTLQAIRFSDLTGTLDDAQVSGGFSYRTGEKPELGLRLVTDSLNVDRYAPDGLMPGQDAKGRLDALIGIVAASMGFGDFQLTLQADRVRLHGVEAEDLAVDIGANEDGLELRTVQIGNVGHSRLDVAGLVRFPGETVAGSVNARVDAEDPRGLFRLFGVIEGDPKDEPPWIAALGALDLKLVAEASSHNLYTQATASLTGSAGPMRIAADGRFDGEVGHWRAGHFNLSGEANSASSALIAALAGLDIEGEGGGSRLKLTATGSFERGVSTTAEADVLGTKLQLAGTLRQDGALSFEGRGALLAERASGVLAALGLPAADLSPLAGVLSAESGITYDGSVLSLTGLSGTAVGSSYQGDIRIALKPTTRVTGQVSTGRLSLPWLLAALLVRPEGEVNLTDPFRSELPIEGAVEVSLAANRLVLVDGFDLDGARLELKLGPTLNIHAEGLGASKLPAKLGLDMALAQSGATVKGTLDSRFDLESVFRTDEGRPPIEGVAAVTLSFSGGGRTPAGLLAALSGSGAYELASGTLKRVDPTAFGRDLASARTPTDVDRLIRGSLRSGDVAFVGGKGALTLAGGVLKASPLAVAGQGMTGELRALIEAADGEADLALTVALIEPAGLPAFELAYAGPPSAMQPSSDTQELKSELAVRVLKEGIDQLEELQRQERRLLEEEEQFRREQAAREENEREKRRRLDEINARRRIERERPPTDRQQSRPADPLTAPVPRIEQTNAKPAPATAASQPAAEKPTGAERPKAAAEVAPVPRKKPAPSRAGLEPSGPVVLQAPAPARSPSLLFPNDPPAPLPDFPARAQGRDR